MRALLDVNFLIALLDVDHVHHGAAKDWLTRNIRQGWASCPITQNGCVRILSQRAYPGHFPVGEVLARLREAAATADHAFWPDDVSLLDERVVAGEALLTSNSLTDAYLLALAVRHKGRLVTFDRNVPLSSVHGATAWNMVVI